MLTGDSDRVVMPVSDSREFDDRDDSGGLLLVFAETGLRDHLLGVDLVAFGARQYRRGHRERLGADLDGGLGIGDEVVVPGGVVVGAGLAGKDEQPVVI